MVLMRIFYILQILKLTFIHKAHLKTTYVQLRKYTGDNI